MFTFTVELVGQPFQEQQPEDKLLELRSIHLAAQNVGGFEQEGFELSQGDFFSHLSTSSWEMDEVETLSLQVSQEPLSFFSERSFLPHLIDKQPKAILFSEVHTF